MNADVLDVLRAADPAASMPETAPDDRERLRRTIVATPLDSRLQPPRRHARPRLVLVAGIAGGVILLGGGGVYAATRLLEPLPKGPYPPMSAEQWRDEYNAWTHKLDLPPGATWRGFRDPGASTDEGAGAFDAVLEAMGHWTREWIAASKAGDTPRAAVAGDWVARLWALVPTVTSGDQSLLGMDPDSKAYWNAAMAEAKKGDFDRLRRLVLGFTYWSSPEPRPSGPTHFLGWMSGGPGVMVEIPVDQARAEYKAVVSAVGVPPGVNLDEHRELLRGSGVDRNHYYIGDGFVNAFDDAWTAWWREWLVAAKAGDEERSAAAAAATARLQGLVPRTLSWSGSKATWALEPEPRRDLEQLATRAREGDTKGIEEWLAFQDWYARSMRDAAGYNVQ